MKPSNILHTLGIYGLIIASICSLSDGYSQKIYSQRGRAWWKTNNEFGPTLGITSFFGDLGGTREIGRNFVQDLDFQTIRPAIGMIFRKSFDTRWYFRTSLIYATIAGNDIYSRAPERVDGAGFFRYKRNLNFKSNLFEFVMQAEFNILNFIPGDYNARWSPYLSLGVGAVYFNPKGRYIDDKWYALQPMGTEGQGLPEYPQRRKYSRIAMIMPTAFGIRANLNKSYIMTFEFAHRLSNTDYMDDVSTTYADINEDTYSAKTLSVEEIERRIYFANPALEKDYTSAPGQQRGDPTDNDAYGFTGIVSITYIINKKTSAYNCPGRFSF